MRNGMILISGCSGGGKSTLIAALAQHGYATVPEPGRRIVAEEMRKGGGALPWVNMTAFSRRAMQMAQADLTAAAQKVSPVFFDRGLVDAAVAYADATGPDPSTVLGPKRHYATQVFLAPPWPEIFVQDADRRHSFEEAEAEYLRLARTFDDLGYEICILPKRSVAARVDFLLSHLTTVKS